MAMTKAQLPGATPIALFRDVFGMREGQTLSDFVAECRPVRENTEFIEECRKYAIEHAVA